MLSSPMSIKLKFENSNKIYELNLQESEASPFLDQQKIFLETADYENLETRMMCHLFNPETHMFILNTSELKSGKRI